MAIYDDVINDHEERIEALEEGGGGSTPPASSVSYDDSSTSYGASNVQNALEKVKDLITSVTGRFSDYFPKAGGNIEGDTNIKRNLVVDGNAEVKGVIDGTTTGNALPIVVDTANITGSVNGSSTATLSGSVALDGFAPLGVVGYEIAGSSQCYVYRQYITGTQARFYVRNNGSGTVNLTITAHVLYQVSDTVPADEPAPLNEGE